MKYSSHKLNSASPAGFEPATLQTEVGNNNNSAMLLHVWEEVNAKLENHISYN